MQIIDGKATATAIKAEIAAEVKEIVARGGKQPHLAAVLAQSPIPNYFIKKFKNINNKFKYLNNN